MLITMANLEGCIHYPIQTHYSTVLGFVGPKAEKALVNMSMIV